MKTRLLTILLVVLAAVTISCKKEDPDKTYFKEIPWSEDAVIPADMAVDLGICDHLKWRSGNLGATHAEDYGDYYAWGETETYYQAGDAQKETGVVWKEGKENGYMPDWSSYTKFTTDEGETFSRYTGNDFTTLQAEDDVATKLLGGKWRIPTDDEWKELLHNYKNEIDKEWVTLCGKPGWKFTSKVEGCEGNYIFLPAAGYRYGTGLEGVGLYVFCWSSSHMELYPGNACYVYLNEENVYRGGGCRYLGYSVRPVSN